MSSPHPATTTAGTAGRESVRLPALSIMQPWAYLILTGGKDVENRTWTTSYRGLLAIHAGRRLDRDAALGLSGLCGAGRLPWPLPDRPAAARGALLGLVTLVGIHHVADCWDEEFGCCSWWAEEADGYHWQLTNPRILAEPIPTPGRLRLWPVTLPTVATRGDR
jgi:hypothetical protein